MDYESIKEKSGEMVYKLFIDFEVMCKDLGIKLSNSDESLLIISLILLFMYIVFRIIKHNKSKFNYRKKEDIIVTKENLYTNLYKINKANGLVSKKYLDYYYGEVLKNVDKKHFKYYINPSFLKQTYSKSLNLSKVVNINLISPTTKQTTYMDFSHPFKNRIQELNSIFNLSYKFREITFPQFMSNPTWSMHYNTINIFIIGGNNEFLHTNEYVNKYIKAIEEFLIDSNNKSIVVTGLGHSDFTNPVNIMSNFCYNTPTSAGEHIIDDILSLPIKKNYINFKKNISK